MNAVFPTVIAQTLEKPGRIPKHAVLVGTATVASQQRQRQALVRGIETRRLDVPLSRYGNGDTHAQWQSEKGLQIEEVLVDAKRLGVRHPDRETYFLLDELSFHLGIKLLQPLFAAKLLADEQIHQLSSGFFLTVQAERLTNHRNLADLSVAVAERNNRCSQ